MGLTVLTAGTVFANNGLITKQSTRNNVNQAALNVIMGSVLNGWIILISIPSPMMAVVSWNRRDGTIGNIRLLKIALFVTRSLKEIVILVNVCVNQVTKCTCMKIQ